MELTVPLLLEVGSAGTVDERLTADGAGGSRLRAAPLTALGTSAMLEGGWHGVYIGGDQGERRSTEMNDIKGEPSTVPRSPS